MSTLGYALGFGPLWIPDVPVPCQSDPDAWFPVAGRAVTAVGFCRGCPVRLDCAAAAIAQDERHGIWGGLTAPQRKQREKAS